MSQSFIDKLVFSIHLNGPMTTQQIYSLFEDMNPKTVSWHLHDELSKGRIRRLSHGSYAIASGIPELEERQKAIPQLSQEAYSVLKASGYEFYLSGLDCLNGIAFKVDGAYPVIVCTRPHLLKDVQLLLMREFDLAITENEFDLLADESIRSRIQFVVLGTRNMKLQKEGFAFTEKAFVDLYYACTRLEYPLNISELPHVLSLISPNVYRFKQSTKDRGLSDELNFLMSYDKQFLKEMVKYI